ncbi:hypothetical protein BHE74_00014805 [Ensete ventricosum]|nr:hypothetical protein BHE74_00014805 [Ensete ventricosum]
MGGSQSLYPNIADALCLCYNFFMDCCCAWRRPQGGEDYRTPVESRWLVVDHYGSNMGLEFEEWVASVRRRSGKCLSQGNLHGLPLRDAMPPKTSALIPSPRCGYAK